MILDLVSGGCRCEHSDDSHTTINEKVCSLSLAVCVCAQACVYVIGCNIYSSSLSGQNAASQEKNGWKISS